MRSPALGTRRELDRRIIALAIPALGTLAIEPLYVLVDTAIVGRLGTPQLGGLAIASTILLTVISLTASLEYGVTPDVAFAHGSGRADEARDVATAALRLAVMIGVPIGAIVAAAAHPLAWLLGGRGDVLGYAVVYLRISCIGLPFVLITYVGHGVMRGVNDLRKPLRIVLIANVVNLVFEIIAVYWLDLGIAGSAWSTVIVQAGAALTFLARAAAASWQRSADSRAAEEHAAQRRALRGSLAGDVRGVEHVDGRGGAGRHTDARCSPGADPAVHVPGA